MRKKWWKSTTAWVTIWAIAFLTYSLIAKINLPWISATAPILASAVALYIGGNKAVDYRHGPEQEKGD
jgi:hypothetical protein